MAHGARVARAAVAPPARAQLDGRRARRALQAGGAGGGGEQPQAGRAVDRRRVPAREQLEHAVEVVDLELARHVRPAQAELAGRGERVADRTRRVRAEHRAAAARGLKGAAVPEAQLERPLRQGCRELAAQRLSRRSQARDTDAQP